MKSLFSFLGVIAAVTASSYASADIVDSVIVNDGTNDITLSVVGNPGGTATNYPSGASAALQSFVSGGVTYTPIAADGYVGDVEGVLAPVGTTAFPSASDALSDLDLSTGSLDPYGDGTFVGNEFFDFSTQTIASDTVFFLFSNATGTQAVALVDSTGADITTALFGADNQGTPNIGGEAQINDFSFSRTNGGDLDNREVFGNTFAVSEFTFNAGSTLADVAGFRGQGNSFDAQDAGIAIPAAVPEPSSAILLVGGLGTFLVRRRRK